MLPLEAHPTPTTSPPKKTLTSKLLDSVPAKETLHVIKAFEIQDYLGLSSWPSIITRVLFRETKEQGTERCDDGRRGQERIKMATKMALKVVKEP